MVKYRMVDGLPTSKYGTTIVKRCKWCLGIINPKATGQGGDIRHLDVFNAVFCSEDCKQDEADWNYINTLKKNREGVKKRYYLKRPKGTPRKKRFDAKYHTEEEKAKAKKEYYQRNKKRLCLQAKLYREKKKRLSASIATN
jgi:hypothetical protein